MDTHKVPNRTRKNDMMLRLADDERAALDLLAELRGLTRSEVIRALILSAANSVSKRAKAAK